MKKRIAYIVLGCILILFIGFYAIVDKNNGIYDKNIDTSQYIAIGLEKGESIEQTFVSKEDILNAINVKMSVSGQPQDKAVSFELKDDKGDVLVSGNTSLEKMKTGKFFKFAFEEQSGCKGQKYTFVLKIDRCDAGNQVIIYTVPNTEKKAECIVNGEKVDGVMALRTVTHRFDLETFIVTTVFMIYVILFIKWLAKVFK